ncbi:hypothetical protein, partial [Escherichia coli]|uniref:hypothetical protein n=1 Tax=Escherichia coli TaxID=562 RepID=UPI000D0AD3E5
TRKRGAHSATHQITEWKDKKRAPRRPFSWLTKEEKAWFFLLCGYQPKINELIFLVFYLLLSVNPARA